MHDSSVVEDHMNMYTTEDNDQTRLLMSSFSFVRIIWRDFAFLSKKKKNSFSLSSQRSYSFSLTLLIDPKKLNGRPTPGFGQRSIPIKE